jgi:hypothetical protein
MKNDSMIMNEKDCGRKWKWSTQWHFDEICLEEQGKSTGNVRIDSGLRFGRGMSKREGWPHHHGTWVGNLVNI